MRVPYVVSTKTETYYPLCFYLHSKYNIAGQHKLSNLNSLENRDMKPGEVIYEIQQ